MSHKVRGEHSERKVRVLTQAYGKRDPNVTLYGSAKKILNLGGVERILLLSSEKITEIARLASARKIPVEYFEKAKDIVNYCRDAPEKMLLCVTQSMGSASRVYSALPRGVVSQLDTVF